MSRDAGERLKDILAAIERCQQYRPRLEDQDPGIATMAYDAVMRNLAVIGEAARSLPEDVKLQSPETPWQSIVGLRNVVVHEYFRVDRELVVGVLEEYLAPLAEIIRTQLSS